MKILIFGGDGQLGRDLQAALAPHELKPVSHADTDIVQPGPIDTVVGDAKPDWVINAAAMTHVDRCETEAADAFAVNAIGACHLATAAEACGARMLQVSTDYVFDGRRRQPYTEDDVPHPLNTYGLSKLAGEFYVRNAASQHYIVRTSGLYGIHPCRGKGMNFVEKMLRLAEGRRTIRVVDDEVLTPTFGRDLAAQIRSLIESGLPSGIYHATNSGACSWFEFAGEVFRLSGIDVQLEPTTAAEWKAPARRPAYSVLENEALRRDGIDEMPPWQDALERYIRELRRS